MKKVLHAIALAAGLLGTSFVCANAASVTAVISSNTISISSVTILLQPHESLSYSLGGVATGTIRIERTETGENWTPISGVSFTGAGLVSQSGTLASGDRSAYYRWKATTMTAGGFVATIADNDDFVSESKNRKGKSTFQLYDETVRIYANENVYGLLLSTLTTSGNSTGKTIQAYLAGSTNAVEGNLMVATHPAVGYGLAVVVAPAVTDLTSFLGIAKAATSTGSLVDVYYSGFVLALTTGTVLPGDTLVSTTSAFGYLTGDSTPTSGAAVGVALSSGTASGGLTKIKLK